MLVHHYIQDSNGNNTTTKVPKAVNEVVVEGETVDDVTINGRVDDSYTTSAATNIPEYYELVAEPTNKSGTIDVFMKLQNGDLLFSVADNGNGIPAEDIPHLFKRFSQGTTKKRSTGTGLGLYLSRQIIEAHGGKIWVESKVNKGSEFSFLLTDVTAKSRVV